jgi:hypothetical protein
LLPRPLPSDAPAGSHERGLVGCLVGLARHIDGRADRVSTGHQAGDVEHLDRNESRSADAPTVSWAALVRFIESATSQSHKPKGEPGVQAGHTRALQSWP